MGQTNHRAVCEFDAHRLASLRRLHESGSVLALQEALQYCLENAVSAPPWVLAGAAAAVAQTDGNTKKKRRKVGRAADGLARDRQLLVHLLRWDFVKDLQRAREKYRHELELIRENPGFHREGMRIRLERAVWKLGSDLETLFEVSADFLAGTALAGQPATIRASFRRVERDMKCEATAKKYYVYSHATLRAFGLETLLESPSITKFQELFAS